MSCIVRGTLLTWHWLIGGSVSAKERGMVKRRSNMRDVAHAAKVSVSSVSLVVRGMPGVGAETRERVWAAIAELGYTPPAPTSNGKGHAVALLIEKNVMPVILDVFY